MGRPAFRSARSLFELSLFGPDLFDDEALAARYLDHDIITRLELARHQNLEGLAGKKLGDDEASIRAVPMLRSHRETQHYGRGRSARFGNCTGSASRPWST